MQLYAKTVRMIQGRVLHKTYGAYSGVLFLKRKPLACEPIVKTIQPNYQGYFELDVIQPGTYYVYNEYSLIANQTIHELVVNPNATRILITLA